MNNLYELKIINKSPRDHKRNIDICLEIANGKSYKETSNKYNISACRVSQIYRVFSAKLYEQVFGVPYADAVYDKKCYRNPEMPLILKKYKDFWEASR